MASEAITPEDGASIVNLVGSYGHHWDGGQIDAFAALFRPDAVIDLGGVILHGAEALRAFHRARMADFHAAGLQRRHLLGSVMVTPLSADRAAVDAYGVVFSTARGTSETTILPPVRYTAIAVRDDAGRWGIAEWTAQPDAPFPPIERR